MDNILVHIYLKKLLQKVYTKEFTCCTSRFQTSIFPSAKITLYIVIKGNLTNLLAKSQTVKLLNILATLLYLNVFLSCTELSKIQLR